MHLLTVWLDNYPGEDDIRKAGLGNYQGENYIRKAWLGNYPGETEVGLGEVRCAIRRHIRPQPIQIVYKLTQISLSIKI